MYFKFKIFITLSFLLLINKCYAVLAQNNKYTLMNGKFQTEQKYKEIFKNKALFTVGKRANRTVYTTLSVNAILTISNFLLTEKIPIELDFSNLSLEKLPFSNNMLYDYPHWPKEIKRIIFIALVWEEVSRLNIFEGAEKEIQLKTDDVLNKKPWKILPVAIAERIDGFSREKIASYVEIVLRTNVFYTIRGGLEQNPSLYSIPFYWYVNKTNTPNGKIETIFLDETERP
ncbi:MAG: hypothetical protein K2X39_09455 [Silvanigrellaceae bacterium]|nr:hypothetical protein [Silvanigrellaceae bacterium]